MGIILPCCQDNIFKKISEHCFLKNNGLQALFFHLNNFYGVYCFQCKLIKDIHLISRVRLFATPWTVAHQASLSMGFLRQEYWSG